MCWLTSQARIYNIDSKIGNFLYYFILTNIVEYHNLYWFLFSWLIATIIIYTLYYAYAILEVLFGSLDQVLSFDNSCALIWKHNKIDII